ncbi:hypothetical protein ACWCW7_15670 [Nocardia tengchongensis]|uniref:Uncharacterized protein n=1 Tax=Nocardia tengchongensis TaxID=2055889 RepID=A0ABX8CV05_9NOCA|nr:hypothetical protein [Nocardia tengchongensis]QVI23734.1 hypothetical protein KHQ06_13435 [Nocardia tengchongensis]
MNNNACIASTGISAGRVSMTSVMSVAPVSLGILASQGIRLSGMGGDLGLQVFASKAQADQQIVIKQDKPKGYWFPAAAVVDNNAVAVETVTGATGSERPVHLLAARPNTTDPASVNRSRHRSRLR